MAFPICVACLCRPPGPPQEAEDLSQPEEQGDEQGCAEFLGIVCWPRATQSAVDMSVDGSASSYATCLNVRPEVHTSARMQIL